MRILIDFLFPKRLARLSYFFRILLCNGVMLYLYQDVLEETLSGVVALIALMLYTSIFVLVPRIRDIGMQTWWIVLAFIPYVSSFLGVVLLFRRTNPGLNPLLHGSSGISIPSRPGAATGISKPQ
jgi:uncharacterized membrane protein YhaH (DUF805 family)